MNRSAPQWKTILLILSLNSLTLISFILRILIFFLLIFGFLIDNVATTKAWSEMKLAHSHDVTHDFELWSLVIIRSKVLPLLWVGLWMGWVSYRASIVTLKSMVSLDVMSWTWMFRSPSMIIWWDSCSNNSVTKSINSSTNRVTGVLGGL